MLRGRRLVLIRANDLVLEEFPTQLATLVNWPPRHTKNLEYFQSAWKLLKM
jgi:hypothetical protein